MPSRFAETIPEIAVRREPRGQCEAVDWAAVWLPEGGEGPTESYVNLIPTPLGGTHVNGFRTGLLEAVARVLRVSHPAAARGEARAGRRLGALPPTCSRSKMNDPQFTGQTKDRLSSRECAAFVSGVVKNAFSLWLGQHPDDGDRIAEIAISKRTASHACGKAGGAQEGHLRGRRFPASSPIARRRISPRTELFLVEGDSAGGSAKQARDREFQAVMPLRGKILNTWEVESGQVLASQEVHDISIAVGVDPGSEDLSGLRYGKICILADADSDGAHIASLLCALFVRHFRSLVAAGNRVYRRHATALPHRRR